jgi:hypothetical protein
MSAVDQILVTFEKIAAASPTLIFDFLIFDIRQWNLTGHHLIQDERQQQYTTVTLTNGNTYSVPQSVINTILLISPAGLLLQATGLLSSTSTMIDDVLKSVGTFLRGI